MEIWRFVKRGELHGKCVKAARSSAYDSNTWMPVTAVL